MWHTDQEKWVFVLELVLVSAWKSIKLSACVSAVDKSHKKCDMTHQLLCVDRAMQVSQVTHLSSCHFIVTRVSSENL